MNEYRTPFIIAELSCNHAGSIDTASELIEAAHAAGADAIKLQCWSKDRMVLDPNYVLRDGPWVGRNLAKLYEEAYTPWEWYGRLFQEARQLGLVPFATVFDLKALDFLEQLGCNLYKIASIELTDLRLIRNVAATKKPLILSTGMATYAEIEDAVYEARSSGATDITLLRCVSAYPSDPKAANLATMWHMRSNFRCDVGLSDHSKGIGVAIAAAAVGAQVIEKHLVLDRTETLDREFSLVPEDFAQMVRGCRQAKDAFGEATYGPIDQEKPQLALRRSIYFTRDMQPGEQVRRDDVDVARPARGLAPRYFERVVGRTLTAPVAAGQPVTWEVMEGKAELTA